MKYAIRTLLFLSFLFIGCVAFSSCEKEYAEMPVITDNNTGSIDIGGSSGTGGSSGSGSSTSYKDCPTCGGDGVCTGSNCSHGTCTRCGGKGYTMSGNYKTTCPWCERGKCPACKGSGKCNRCNGRGYIN